MKRNNNEEMDNSLETFAENLNLDMINEVIDKIIFSNNYEELFDFLNYLYDFANIPDDIVDRLINDDKKECVSYFLENEEFLYFLNDKDINKLKKYLDVYEINVKLDKDYDYYYDLLLNQTVLPWKTKKKNKVIEYTFTRYNKLINIKLKKINKILVVSCVIYSNYDLSKEEQLLKEIDYINEYGFNIERNVNNKDIIVVNDL